MMRRRTSPRLGRVVAIARRDLAIELSYQLRLIIRYLSVGALAVLVFYASDLVQDPEELEGFAGGYYEFVIVGLAVTAFADLGLSSFTRRMSEEQAQGTLEALLATPTRPGTLLTGGFLVPLLLTAVEVALLVGFGIGVAGVGIPVGGLLISLPLFILTIISFCTLGIISAALIIVAKRGDPLTGPAYQLTLLLSGAVFPIEVFPVGLRVVSHLVPAFYGIRGIREALLGDGGVRDVAGDTAIVAAFCLVLVPLATWVFTRSIATAKRAGTLGSY